MAFISITKPVWRAPTLAHANVLVSIHMNGFGDRSVGGAETIYDAVRPFATANEQLARLLQSDILASVRAAGWLEHPRPRRPD